MNKEDFDTNDIQKLIGYEFKNKGLLKQAFTRRSYSQENPTIANNEILEFYGDSALDFYVCREMADSFGEILENQFVSEKNEGELTKIRSLSVNKQKLAHCIEVLGLEKFLILGTSDIKNESWKSDSVKEDLFESIIGAVAVDSNWNSDDIKQVCQNLFSISDFSENYIALLEEECEKHGWEKPLIWDPSEFSRCFQSKQKQFSMNCFSIIEQPQAVFPLGERISVRIRNLRNSICDYEPTFGSTKPEAIMLSAKKYYEWLLRRDKIKQEIVAINENLAVNQLHELQQKGLIKEPRYNFSESYDKDGNPVWKCVCKLSEAEYPFEAENSSKKKVKQEVANKALKFLIGEETSLNREGVNK